MKPVEIAKQLAKALAESNEYLKYKECKQTLDKNQTAKDMLGDFRKKQWELERRKINGEKLLEPHEEELRKLAEIIGLNPYIRDFLMAEYQFTQLLMQIQQIIGEAVELEMPIELS